MKKAMNRMLPNDIEIDKISEEADDFNARYLPKKSSYEYILTWKKDVFSRRYKTFIREEVEWIGKQKGREGRDRRGST